MTYARTDARRKGLHQDFSPLILAYDWSVPNAIKTKGVRSIVLSGMQDLNLYGLIINKPVGIIELVGSRAGALSTLFLAIFSEDNQANAASFCLTDDYAIGTLGFPAPMFAAVLQMVAAESVYFRIGRDAERNAISTDVSFAMNG